MIAIDYSCIAAIKKKARHKSRASPHPWEYCSLNTENLENGYLDCTYITYFSHNL